MEQAAADARYARVHDERKWHNGDFTSWAEKPSREHPYRYDFGVTIGVAETDLYPDDKFLSDERCGPLPTQKPDDHERQAGDTQHQDQEP